MSGSRSGASWYDLLGVPSDATPAQIKAAWRDATDRFEPGSGTSQFRLFNEAADVLLDPDRRAAYDQELEPKPVKPKTPVEQRGTSASRPASPEQPTPVEQRGTSASRPASPERTLRVRQASATPSTPTTSPLRTRTRTGTATTSRAPLWLLALLVVLVLAVAAVGGIFTVKNHDDGQQDDAGQEASAAAERALPAVLSYDYRRLKADRTRADAFLTPAYRKEYNATFDKLIESNGSPGPAAQAKAVVKATVQNVGVVAAQPDRVRVIAFVNQTTTKGTGSPTLALNRLTVSMRRSGNAWLLEDITSY